ncbi:MAG: hypothetical protein OXT07_16600 [bacterium]|nr:hypothetical protein [bacterium]
MTERFKWVLIAAVVLAGPVNFLIVGKGSECNDPDPKYGCGYHRGMDRWYDFPGWYPEPLANPLGFWLPMAVSAIALFIGYCEWGSWRREA